MLGLFYTLCAITIILASVFSRLALGLILLLWIGYVAAVCIKLQGEK